MSTPPPIPKQQPQPTPVPHQQQKLGNDAGMRLLLPVGRSGWAIAAGYLGLFALIIFPAPLALIVSIIAIRDLKKNTLQETQKHGMGRAVFGLITGLIGTIILIPLLISILSKS